MLISIVSIFLLNLRLPSTYNMDILKVVQGSFSQNDNRFGKSCGKQCACMALTSICMTNVRKPFIWKEVDLDFILMQGDALYKTTGIDRSLYSDELPKVFEVGNHLFQIDYPQINDRFCNDENNFDEFLDEEYFATVTGAIIFVNDYCISILKDDNFFFVFDSHSRNTNGQPTPDGTSILMMFKSIENVKAYVLKTYPNCRHLQIVFVKTYEITDKEKNLFKKSFLSTKDMFNI